MDGAYGIYEGEKCRQSYGRKPDSKRPLKTYALVVGFHKHYNEPSGSIKCLVS
jgi:hypothetical protein